MKQQFLKDKASTIKIQIYADNTAVIPSAATITVYKPGGSTELVANTAATVDATTGEISYALTTTHTATNDLNYKAVWSYTVGGVVYYQNQLFDVVKSVLGIPIIDDDLFTELAILRDEATQATGTATAGAAGSLTDTAKLKQADDFWKGGQIEIIAGTGDTQRRLVTGNTQSTGVVTVSPNWTTNPSTDSVYRIVRSFTRQIELAFEKLSVMLYNKGKRHSLILESSQIKIPLIYLTVHFICIDLMSEPDDVWHTRANIYWDRFNESFNGMTLDYDEDESGSIEGQEEQQQATGFSISRS